MTIPLSGASPDAIWARLTEAVGAPADPMNRMAVATADAGGPDLRMVVLRGVNARERMLSFHTDARSPKCAAIAADPRVGLLFWDSGAQLQLRCRAIARLIASGAEVDAAWDALSARQRTLYDAPHAPGAQPDGPPTPPLARAAFRLADCRVTAIDALVLREDGQARWLIDYGDDAPQLRPIAP